MSNLVETLTKIGLSEREAQVYVAALDLGPSGVVALSRRTGLNRPAVYSIIESLKGRGLMETRLDGLKTHFAALSPDQFDALISDQRRIFKSVLPDLMAKFKLRGSKSQIKYYAGFESIKSIYEELLRQLRNGDYFYVMSNQNNWTDNFEIDWLENWIERRSRKQLNTKVILTNTERNRFAQTMNKAWNQEVRLIEKSIDVEILITPTSYIMISLKEPVGGTLIENEETVATQKELFEYIWGTLPSVDKS